MLKEKRVEYHAGVCYVVTLIFIAVALLCLCGNYAFVERINARVEGGEHIVSHYSGYSLLNYFGDPIDYNYDFYTVAATANFILLVVMGIMFLSIALGTLSTRQEAFKKSLVMLDICYVIALVMVVFSPLQIMSRVIQLSEEIPNIVEYSFGFIPWISVVVCAVAFVIFKIYYKDGYCRKPGTEPRFAPKAYKNKNEVVETAVVLPEGDAEVVTPDSTVVDVDEVPVVETAESSEEKPNA